LTFSTKTNLYFLENWYRNNIVLVGQLYDTSGSLYSYSEFLQKFQIPVSVKEYAIVFGAIPSGIRMLLGGINFPWPLTHNMDLSDTAVGRLCFSAVTKNKTIRALYQK